MRDKLDCNAMIKELAESDLPCRSIGPEAIKLRFGVKNFTPDIAKKQKDAGNVIFEGLSNHTALCLLYNGYETKEQIIAGIKSGSLHPKRNSAINYGVKKHQEVLSWLGMTTEVESIHPNTLKWHISVLERHGYKVTKLT